MNEEKIGVLEPMPGVVYPNPEELAQYVAAGALTRETLAAAFCESLVKHASRVAIRTPDLTLTYADLDERSNRAAAALIHAGLKPLDRVVFQIPNSPELLIAFIACLKAGLIPICTLEAHRELEIGYLANHAKARAFLVPANHPRFDFLSFAQGIQAKTPSLQHVITVGEGAAPERFGFKSMSALIDAEDPGAARDLVKKVVASLDPFQVAIFQLSGGTTSVPKIIPRFQNDYLYNMRIAGEFLGITASEIVLTPAPMLHNAQMGCFWGPALLCGGMVAIAKGLTAAQIAQALVSLRPTFILVPTPLFPVFSEALESAKDAFQSVRAVVSVSPSAARKLFPVPVLPTFGMTEGVEMFGKLEDPDEALDSTVGRPLSPLDQIKLVKPGTNEPVPFGEIGELLIKGPYTIHGYYDSPERNAEVFTSDGFYRSGDLMAVTELGGRHYYLFRGRIKDLIDRGGEKVNCEEVEHLVRKFPGVLEVAVVPFPDAKYGERGGAILIMNEGAKVPTVQELGAFLGGFGLAKFKWPEQIDVVSEFPAGSSGKVNKAALRDSVLKAREAAGLKNDFR